MGGGQGGVDVGVDQTGTEPAGLDPMDMGSVGWGSWRL